MIPISVLFGIFLYFGIVSLSGTQLYERIKLIFIPSKYCPNHVYARGVSRLVLKITTGLWKLMLVHLFEIRCDHQREIYSRSSKSVLLSCCWGLSHLQSFLTYSRSYSSYWYRYERLSCPKSSPTKNSNRCVDLSHIGKFTSFTLSLTVNLFI